MGLHIHERIESTRTLLAPIETAKPGRALELTNGPPAARSPATE